MMMPRLAVSLAVTLLFLTSLSSALSIFPIVPCDDKCVKNILESLGDLNLDNLLGLHPNTPSPSPYPSTAYNSTTSINSPSHAKRAYSAQDTPPSDDTTAATRTTSVSASASSSAPVFSFDTGTLPKAAIAGIVLGIIIFVVMCLIGCLCCLRWNKRTRRELNDARARLRMQDTLGWQRPGWTGGRVPMVGVADPGHAQVWVPEPIKIRR